MAKPKYNIAEPVYFSFASASLCVFLWLKETEVFLGQLPSVDLKVSVALGKSNTFPMIIF